MLDLRTSFSCEGSLRYPDGTNYKASGRVELITGTKIRCILQLDLRDADPFLFLVQQANLEATHHPEFTGITEGGQPLTASGLTIDPQDPFQLLASEVTVGHVSTSSSVRFFISNLDLTPRFVYVQEPTRAYSVPQSWSVPIPESLGSGEAELYVRSDIEHVRTTAREDNLPVFTTVLTLKKSEGVLAWADIEEPVYRLCLLLSLASGRHINWSVAQGEDWWIYRRHVVSDWKGRGATVWIKSFADSVKSLLACWPKVCSLTPGKTLALRRAVNLYLHSGPSFAFPVPFYCTGGAFEVLCTAFLKDNKSGYLPSKDVFREVRESFKDWATKNFLSRVTDANLANEFLQSGDGKFNGLNSRSLRARIIGLARQLELAHSEEQVGRFVTLRNAATHPNDLKEQDEWELFQALAPIDDLLVRVMLRLVGYVGEYWGGSDGFGTIRPLE